tara:strand:+ start:553 stop:951 length:399 start_codon:yes stop_codon:yes gene_type:complete
MKSSTKNPKQIKVQLSLSPAINQLVDAWSTALGCPKSQVLHLLFNRGLEEAFAGRMIPEAVEELYQKTTRAALMQPVLENTEPIINETPDLAHNNPEQLRGIDLLDTKLAAIKATDPLSDISFSDQFSHSSS